MWKIKDIEINGQVVLAPMAGISNAAYIKICEDMGLSYAITELISSEAIIRGNKKTFDMLNGLEDINIPLAIQIFGSNPKTMADAAKILVDNYNAKIIDINMGCPVPKVAVKNDAGSGLLKNPDLVREIVESVVKAVEVPVTVKIRSGWDSESINAVEIAKIIEEAGASLISVHARTRAQGYTGKADWNIIKEVKQNVHIPVIGNGDVISPESALDMINQTGCDAVMIGRAALGNPWLIKNVKDYLTIKHYDSAPLIQERIEMIKHHYNLLRTYKTEKLALLEIRTNAIWYLKGIPGASEVKRQICSAKSSEELFKILDDYADTCS